MLPKHMQFDGEYGFDWCENIIGIIVKSCLLIFLGGDNLESVWKPCLKDCYQTNGSMAP